MCWCMCVYWCYVCVYGGGDHRGLCERTPSFPKRRSAELALSVKSVLVDTLSRAFTGDSQNDATQVRAWIRQVNQWARLVVGATDLVVTDHAGHAEAMRAAGSSAQEADADHIIHLALSDPKDQNSPRHIRTFGRTEALLKGELLLDKETETHTKNGRANSGTQV